MNYKFDVELSTELEPYREAIARTIQPYIKIELTDNSSSSWWQSKFGGLPYLPRDFAYPRSERGDYLYLLAQINFAEVPELAGLPTQGILQFYLAADSLYGLNFDDQTKQDKFRVIYFQYANLPEQDLVTDFSFLVPIKEHYFPLEGCCGLKFQVDYAPVSFNDYQFKLFDDDDVSVEAIEEYFAKSNAGGHQLLGYADFIQEDPRTYLSNDEPYILLMQIDSDSNFANIHIQWGDMGIGNFFIKQSALTKLDFSDVLYNWDCG